MLCGQASPAPIDPALSDRAALRSGNKFGAPDMSTSIARRLSFRDTAPSALPHLKAWMSRHIAGTRSTVGRWFARSRQRRALREIAERNDFHLLKDIGVSREEAFREADKPFWPD
jgi:uncharacterized protein YjiS (DUF1127 family)